MNTLHSVVPRDSACLSFHDPAPLNLQPLTACAAPAPTQDAAVDPSVALQCGTIAAFNDGSRSAEERIRQLANLCMDIYLASAMSHGNVVPNNVVPFPLVN